MKKGVFAVFDNKAQLHFEPFTAVNQHVALRGFIDSLSNPQSMVAKHPEDYNLFFIATFEDEKGVFEMLDRPVNLGTASGFVQPKS